MVGPDSSRLLRERIFAAVVALVADLRRRDVRLLARSAASTSARGAGPSATARTSRSSPSPPSASASCRTWRGVPGGRVFTVVVLLSGLGVAALLRLGADHLLHRGRVRPRPRDEETHDQGARQASSDHIIVCGVGTTGMHVVEELMCDQVAGGGDRSRSGSTSSACRSCRRCSCRRCVGDATEDDGARARRDPPRARPGGGAHRRQGQPVHRRLGARSSTRRSRSSPRAST